MLMIVSNLRSFRQNKSTGKQANENTSLSTDLKNLSQPEEKSSSGFFRTERWSLTLTPGNAAYCSIVLSSALPALSQLFFMLYRFIFGLLYPTYRSYKALKYRNHKECARMTMYWVVFALFTSWESILDLFVGFWFPFYTESKILFIFWLSSAYSNGAQLLYEKVVKYQLEENEQRIDRFISRARVLSLDVFYKLWCTFAVYAQQFMIFAVHRMQLALTDYVQNRQEHTITSGEKFVKILSSAFTVTSTEDMDVQQIESTCRIEEIHDEPDSHINNQLPANKNDNVQNMEVDSEEISRPNANLISFDNNDDETDDNIPDNDNEFSDPTFVPKPVKTKKILTNLDENVVENEPKKVKRKRKRVVGIELENADDENLEARPRTRMYTKKASHAVGHVVS